jgi:hypothetical protein
VTPGLLSPRATTAATEGPTSVSRSQRLEPTAPMDIDSGVPETGGCPVCALVRGSRRFPSAVRAVRQPLNQSTETTTGRPDNEQLCRCVPRIVAQTPTRRLSTRPAPVSRDPKGPAAKSDPCSSRQAKQDRGRRTAKPEQHQKCQTGWTTTSSPCCVCLRVFVSMFVFSFKLALGSRCSFM